MDPNAASTNTHIAPFEYSLHVPPDPRAVGVARASLRTALAAHRVPELIDRAQLLASELLTNALVHAGGEAELRLKWLNDTLRLSVWDPNPTPPAFCDLTEDSEHGRGLYLLQTLATRWNHFTLGADLTGTPSKVVWCEISRTPTR